MKTLKPWNTTSFGVLVGLVALIVSLGGPRSQAQETNPAPALPAGSTNAVAVTNVSTTVTNVSASTNEPLATLPPTIPASAGLSDVVKLAQAGVEQNVLLAYVQNSSVAYSPTADELVYLHDVGIPPAVITAMIDHGKQLRDQGAQAMAAASNLAVPTDTAAPAPAPPADAQASIASAAPAVAPAPDAYSGYPVESPSYTVPAPVVAPSPEVLPAPVNDFYDSLTPYGAWYQLPDYGWCWQPSVVVLQPAWRPYFDGGRWLYSDSGWYWNSSYSWGWAPFHYGRWFRNARFGWLWAPDSVWGPAWVCWRQTPVYYGWAPLPPAAIFHAGVGFTYFGAGVTAGFGFGLGVADFAFVPVGHFCDRNFVAYRLSPTLTQNVFNRTIVVNNYIQGPNNRIINLGVDRNRIATVTRTEIPTVAIRDLPPAAGRVAKPDRLERQGSTLVVYRPQSLRAPGLRPASPPVFVPRQEWTVQAPANRNPGPRTIAVTQPRPVVSRPANEAATRLAQNQFALQLEQRVAAPTVQSATPAPSAPLLGRYPTQAPATRPTRRYYPATAPSYNVAPVPRSDAAVPYSLPAVVPRTPPSAGAPAYSSRPTFERPAYAPPAAPAPRAVYTQPRWSPPAPSYQPARPPSVSGGSISRAPAPAPATAGPARRNN